MVDGNFLIPLSPPSSPHMSGYSTSAPDNEWQSSEIRTLEHTPPHSDNDMAMLQADVSGHNFDLKRPSMRSHKTFPYLLDSKNHINAGNDAPTGLDAIEAHRPELDVALLPQVRPDLCGLLGEWCEPFVADAVAGVSQPSLRCLYLLERLPCRLRALGAGNPRGKPRCQRQPDVLTRLEFPRRDLANQSKGSSETCCRVVDWTSGSARARKAVGAVRSPTATATSGIRARHSRRHSPQRSSRTYSSARSPTSAACRETGAGRA